MQYHQIVVTGSGGLPDELLYGRVGFLYSLVYVNQQLGQDRIPLQYIQQVVCVWILARAATINWLTDWQKINQQLFW